MLEFAMVLSVIILIIVSVYLPAFYRYLIWKRTQKKFEHELSELGSLYDSSRIVITKHLGSGTSRILCVTFAQAHENQNFAMNTIMELL